MGRKISVDSATMMNKGLEIIEACWLFNTTPDTIQVVVHPQSVIHSMVEYADGSVLAQLGQPDMRTPIAHAMAWPERIDSGVEKLDLFAIAKLEFERPDYERFPCLRLAEESIRTGGTAPAILNAANEIAVASFLDHKLRFTDIPFIVEKTLEKLISHPVKTLDDVLNADKEARDEAEQWVDFKVKQAG
jgi:1-deoxy-D-xylulose-5-phosphate reductoisomerase